MPRELARQLEGKRFQVNRESTRSNLRVDLYWPDANAGRTIYRRDAYPEGYAMILEFGKASGGKLPGRIYVCLPDEDHSVVAGTFQVKAP